MCVEICKYNDFQWFMIVDFKFGQERFKDLKGHFLPLIRLLNTIKVKLG
jgi:hypothetical protein